MLIKEIVESTKENEQEISGIMVSIQDKNHLTFFDNPTEVFFGELKNLPDEYMPYEILERSTICASSDEERNGANILVIEMEKSIKERNLDYLKQKYKDGLPDGFVFDTNRPLGCTAKESWLQFLEKEKMTLNEFDNIDSYKQYQIHCKYCRIYNIPHVED